MSKKQILIDQILNIANGLNTDAINEVTELLVNLEEKKIKEVLSVIPETEMAELNSLFEELNVQDELPFQIYLECFVHINNRFEGSQFITEPSVRLTIEEGNSYNSDTVHLNSWINKYELLVNSDIKEVYNLRKKKAIQLNRILKIMEEKYKISASTIISHMLHEN